MALIKCRQCGNEVSTEAKTCPKCGATLSKKTNKVAVVVLGFIAVIVIINASSSFTRYGNEARTSEARAVATRLDEQDKEAARSECMRTVEEKKGEYAKHLAANKPWDASLALRACADLLNDPALKKMVADAEQREHVTVANNAKAAPALRVQAIEMLQRDYPDQAKQFEKLLPQLVARKMQIEAAETKKRLAQEAARKRNEGVSIGMTQEDVIASSWGKSRSINRSTYSWGVREQWVYDGGYLYFKDGILESIQN